MAIATKKTKAGTKVEQVFEAIVADLLKVRETIENAKVIEKELLARITAELPAHIDKLELVSGTIERIEKGGTSVTYDQKELRAQLEELAWSAVELIDNAKVEPRASDWEKLGLVPAGRKVSAKKQEIKVSRPA